MLNKLPSLIQNKRIVILGFGMEGQSSFRFFSKHFPNHQFLIADQNDEINTHPLLNQENIKIINTPRNLQSTKWHKILFVIQMFFVKFRVFVFLWQKKNARSSINLQFSTGKDYLNAISKKDFIVKSPGIKLPENCKLSTDLIFSQTDLFIQAFQKQIIGITGTKGKSTTSTLLLKILSDQKKKSILIGNIGKPAFDYWEGIDNETFIIYELSAHQLEYARFSPSYSILLNLFPEHLDYFHSKENYFKAKLNIAKFQTPDDFLFLGDTSIALFVEESIPKKPSPSNYTLSKEQILKIDTAKAILGTDDLLYLKGLHQLKNCIPLLDLSRALQLNEEMTLESIKTFQPLPHRIEFIGKVKQISFYDDSISTIPEASIEALKALHKVDYLILGGLDRTLDYQKLYAFLEDYPLDTVFFIGPAGKRMYDELSSNLKFQKVYIEKLNLFETHLKALIQQDKESICLLSPAAASYDEFKNFEVRGDFFRKLIEKFK